MKNFKSILIAIFAFSAIILSFTSCSPDTDIEFDETLLYGKWQENDTQNFEVYKEDGTGYTWDEADDVTEAEAQHFTWTLEGENLTHIHIMEMGANIPKVYTVTKLSATELAYEDDYGKIHTFSKIQ
ncbi:MAG: hypothetical protein IJY67_03500 [Paludibacteraceae bacterium]|nr:hypothetical protein [Paludibacteraceae bacterium]